MTVIVFCRIVVSLDINRDGAEAENVRLRVGNSVVTTVFYFIQIEKTDIAGLAYVLYSVDFRPNGETVHSVILRSISDKV